jgi:hypothetical protein
MNFEEFKQSLIEEISFNASFEGISENEEFLNEVTRILIDAEEIDGFDYVHFEGIGKRNKKIQIDGYSYDELDECLSIFICPELTHGEETLVLTEANKIFSKATSFVEEANYILDNAEESSPGYGFAYDICNKYKNVRRYKFFIITDMVMSSRIKNINSENINNIETVYNIWDLSRIFELFSSTTVKEDITINFDKYVKDGIPALLANENDDYTAYLCNVPGRLLADIYNEYGSRLLEGNVRSFLQTKGKVNKGIRNTILNNPTMFFAYNNGIAGTANSIETRKVDNALYIKSVTGLQIVNGGQTTASLASALLKDKKDNSEEQINKVFVPMKLSVVSPEKAIELIPNISRYANSQNKVSEADLWSNHPFHIRMEDFSRKTIAPAVNGKQYGTYWYYERANGQYRQESYKMTVAEKRKFDEKYPSRQMFKKTDLAKYWNIMTCRPDRASKGGQSAFADFATYISKQWEIDSNIFNKNFYQNIISIAILYKESERIVKSQPWFNSYRANIVAYTISRIIYEVEHNYKVFSIQYSKIWNNQCLSNGWKKQITLTSKIMYDHLTSEDRNVENVTEWAKREACWNGAKDVKITLCPEFIDDLQAVEYINSEKRNAVKDQKVINGIEAQTFVYSYGVSGWKKLLRWNDSHKVLNSVEISFIYATLDMDKGKIPTEKQCPKIIAVLNHAREEGYPD